MTLVHSSGAAVVIPTEPVFVFGSNLAGRHGKGAALWARQHRGAIYGKGVGPQGNSYAIPTKGWSMETLPLSQIEMHVVGFLIWAEMNRDKKFQLTPVGCGLAGYCRADIEPLFALAPNNVLWPPEWGDRPTPASSVGTKAEGRSEPKSPTQSEEADHG